MENKDPPNKTFEQLVKEKATCLEFALNGYIRLYEEGEKKCECHSCKKLNGLSD